jgi:hypothetical protein
MTPPLRKLGLTFHTVVSVGWLGALGAFLALAIVSLSKDAGLAKAAYLGMEVIGRAVLLPLSAAALLSGVVQSLGTKWGLFRYNWVVTKLVLTTLAAVGLLVHQKTAIAEAARLAEVVSSSVLSSPRLQQLSVQLVADSSLAIAMLGAITAIAVYKPWGLVNRATTGLRLFLAAMAALVAAFIALHLSGRSPHHSH